MKRSAVLVSAVAAAVALSGLLVGPARAEASTGPTVADLDVSVPGHLSGTISSPGAPYLRIGFEASGEPNRTVTINGDSGPFDIETWGYQGQTQIWLQACTDVYRQVCAPWVLAPQTFDAHDVAPASVTWSQDLTVGPQPITASVVDEGGGVLMSQWTGPIYPSRTVLPSTSVLSPDGVGKFEVRRCADMNSDHCVTYPALASPTYTIRRSLGVKASIPATLPGSTATTIDLDTAAAGTYDIAWHLAKNGTALPSPTGSVSNQPLGPNGELARIQFPADTLPDGTYTFEGIVTVTDPDFGRYSKTWGGSFSLVPGAEFRVNRLPPDITSIGVATSARHNGVPAIYPNIRDQEHPGSAWLSVDATDDYSWNSLEIRSADGNLVKSWTKPPPPYGFSTPQWFGTSDSGAQVPTGVYTIVVRDVDGQAAVKTALIYVSTQHRVLKTWTKTVTARRSLVDSYVGRCSTLKRPAARGWAGSLGFYANTRCATKTWRASAVSTMHGIYLPVADRYVRIKIQFYGGAARAAPQSFAGFRLFGRNEQWRKWSVVRSFLGTHTAATISTSSVSYFAFPDRSLYWGMATMAGDRYDIKNFTVTVTYYALV